MSKIKIESMFCGRCGGDGKIKKLIKTKITFGSHTEELFELIDCPNCDGTGELVCISKKQYEHFKRLIEMEKEAVIEQKRTGIN